MAMLKCKTLVHSLVSDLYCHNLCAVQQFSTGWMGCKKEMKWSSGKIVRPKKGKGQQSVNLFKRRNWELVNTFGPLLQTAMERQRLRQEVQNETVDRGRQVTIRVKEAGFKDIETLTLATDTMVTAEVDEEYVRHDPNMSEWLLSDGHNVKMVTKTSPWRVITTSKATDSVEQSVTRPLAVDPLQALSSFPLIRPVSVGSQAQECLDELNTHPAFLSRPSVSSILQKTMPIESARALESWKAGMVAQLRMEGFLKHQAELFEVGKTLHQCIEEYLSMRSFDHLQVDDSIAGYWKSLQQVLADISDVFLLETSIEHPFLLYRGALDCVAKYRGTPMLIEWKTSQRLKASLPDTFDNPLQATAYVGALNFSNNLDFQVKQVAIVVGYSSGVPAHIHVLDEELTKRHWNLWLRRLRQFASINEPF